MTYNPFDMRNIMGPATKFDIQHWYKHNPGQVVVTSIFHWVLLLPILSAPEGYMTGSIEQTHATCPRPCST